jgi:hypothetical protein
MHPPVESGYRRFVQTSAAWRSRDRFTVVVVKKRLHGQPSSHSPAGSHFATERALERGDIADFDFIEDAILDEFHLNSPTSIAE